MNPSGKDSPVQQLIGVIYHVDLSGRELTVNDHGAIKAFSVPTGCSILLHGEPVKLRMLLPGDYARVAYCRGPDALEASSVQVNWWLPPPKGGWQPREGSAGECQDRDRTDTGPGVDSQPARQPGALIADGTDLTLVLLKLELEALGFNVWLAQGSEAAVAVYRLYHDDIDLVLLDAQLPGRGGAETLAALRQINPEVCCCLLAGRGAAPPPGGLLECGTTCVLTGPITPARVARAAQRLVAGRLAVSACPWPEGLEQ